MHGVPKELYTSINKNFGILKNGSKDFDQMLWYIVGLGYLVAVSFAEITFRKYLGFDFNILEV